MSAGASQLEMVGGGVQMEMVGGCVQMKMVGGGNRSPACAEYKNAKLQISRARHFHSLPMRNIKLRQLKYWLYIYIYIYIYIL